MGKLGRMLLVHFPNLPFIVVLGIGDANYHLSNPHSITLKVQAR